MEKESRQVKRARQRADEKEKKRITKELQLSDFTYVADDNNATLSAVAPQIIDFMKVTGMPGHLRKHVNIEKRKSTFGSDMISQLMILQNILGYDRIESSRTLNQDHILKEKLSIDNYPDPETFRDELMKYKPENMEQLLLVNRELLDVMCNLTEPQYVDLHYDAKVITVYGDQEEAKAGCNPHKHGRKSYHLKVCTIEPFGFILAIQLEPGNSVSSTDFIQFHEKCLASVPQDHFVVRVVRMDRGFFAEKIIGSLEGDCLFFEIVAKKYASVKRMIESIPEEDYRQFYPGIEIYGASRTFCLDKWEKPREFAIVKKLAGYDENNQGILFPKWHYQVICHNQEDVSAKEAWEDYNQRAKIELNIKDLDYDHFITKVPTGKFMSNYAYFWHCVLSYNLALIFKQFVLTGEWKKMRTSTLRKKIINTPGRLVNRSGRMVMRMIAGFPYVETFKIIKERLIWLYQMLHPTPA